MQAASVSEIKKQVNNLSKADLMDLCLRLSKFKKENKELLTYLLFEAQNEHQYIENCKAEIDFQFSNINKSNIFFAKKSIRKILRLVVKFSRYSSIAETEIDLRIFYCHQLLASKIPFKQHPALNNLYNNQVEKIEKLVADLHPDLQYDYQKQIEKIK
ncbi:MAG: hypothetical protein RIQ33_1352 [Bacteroidota bacterium]|jgi:hypothetical protein